MPRAPRDPIQLLPHEVVCGGLLLYLWIQLALASGPFTRDAWLILLMLAADTGLLVWCRARPNATRWRVRLAFYAVAMNVVYFLLRWIVPAIHPALEDGALQKADRWLVGGNLSLAWQGAAQPALTDFLSLCYQLYFVYLVASQIRYLLGDLEVAKRYYAGMFTIYGIGFLGYTLLPAAGPHVALAGLFSAPLQGGWLTSANARIVSLGSNGVDVFPSLHCANSLYILLSEYQLKRSRFWLYLVPIVGLGISTIYLRYHYSVDVLCGFLLGGLAWRLANHRVAVAPPEMPVRYIGHADEVA